jgi:hypothetical protein
VIKAQNQELTSKVETQLKEIKDLQASLKE